jgi:hypothetical protein
MITIELNLVPNEHPLTFTLKIYYLIEIVVFYELAILKQFNIFLGGKLCINFLCCLCGKMVRLYLTVAIAMLLNISSLALNILL